MTYAHRVLIIVVVMLGIYFRGDRIQSRPVWGDENITREIARLHPLSKEFYAGILGVVSPAPLDYALTWAWGRMGVDTESQFLRFPSFVYGLLLLGLFWLALQRAFPGQPTAHLVGMAFFSMHVVLTYYSQEARSYSLWALLSGLQAYSLICLLDDSSIHKPNPAFVLLTFTNVLLLQTSSAALFQIVLITGVSLWIAYSAGQFSGKMVVRYAILSMFVPVLLGYAWIYHSIGVRYPAIYWTGSFRGDIEHCFRVIYASVGGGFKWTNRSLWGMIILGALWLRKDLIAPFQGKKTDMKTTILYLFGMSFLCLALIMLGDLRAHYLICQRQLIFVVPFAVLAASIPATHPDKRIRMATLLVALFYVGYNAYRFSLGDRL